MIQVALSDFEIPVAERIMALERLLHEANTTLGRLARIVGRTYQAPIADIDWRTVEDLWACSEKLIDDLARQAPRTLAHATALFGRGRLAVECARMGNVPIIDGYQSALDSLDEAARCLVASLGVATESMAGIPVTLSVVDELVSCVRSSEGYFC
jgi:hypothetical protein